MNRVKRLLPYIGIILGFVILSGLYFWPVVLENKVLPQMDNTHAIGMAQELFELEQQTGEKAQWTNSMFGGMPAFQIKSDSSANLFNYINKVIALGLPYHNIAILFLYLAGFFVLARSMGFNLGLSFLGSVAFAFGSYNLIIIIAGHITKAYAIALMAPVIGGILYTYNRNKWGGALFTAIALGAEIAYNHVQITYYLALLALVLVLDKLVRAIKTKALKDYLRRTALLGVSLVLALLPNISNLWTTYEYGKESIRGKAILAEEEASRPQKGLDPDYVFAWSYGKGETLTLMIPNFNGGGSKPLGMNTDLTRGLQQRINDFLIKNGINYGQHQGQLVNQLSGEIMQQSQYWGSKPFTEGPVYAGAIMCFLFVLALFFYKGDEKWWLLAGTILSIVLAWGHNFEWFNMLMLKYFPLYNKFRTVEMTLVLASLCIPVLGLLGLKTVIQDPDLIKQNTGKFLASLALTGGVCLFFWLFPESLSLVSAFELQSINAGKAAQPDQAIIYDLLLQELKYARALLLKGDAFRSLVLIFLASASIWLYAKKTISLKYLIPGLIILVGLDMWGIDRRYINKDSFISERQANSQFSPTQADLRIKADSDQHYRVFSIDRNAFNEVHTSYFHKSLGGYHGAKLRRYQDLIDYYLTNDFQMLRVAANDTNSVATIQAVLARTPAINMLNAKYIIYNGESDPVQNPYAMGNAWFVNNVRMVSTALDELLGISEVDLSNTAVIHEEFAEILGNETIGAEAGTIELISYHPDRLTYKANTASTQLAVFSEVYYSRGWKAYVNDVEVPIIRANYILRSIFIPAGESTVEFRFEPTSYKYGKLISIAGSILLIALLIFSIVVVVKRKDDKILNTEV